MTSRRAIALFVLLFATPALAGTKSEAKAHFVEGLKAVEAKQYQAALGRFLASWDAYPHPTTAFNIAKAYEDYGDKKRALHWYRRFQEVAPHRASEALEPILRLSEELDPLQAPKPKAPEQEAPKKDKPSMEDVLRELEGK